jgi:hypothetical protein
VLVWNLAAACAWSVTGCVFGSFTAAWLRLVDVQLSNKSATVASWGGVIAAQLRLAATDVPVRPCPVNICWAAMSNGVDTVCLMTSLAMMHNASVASCSLHAATSRNLLMRARSEVRWLARLAARLCQRPIVPSERRFFCCLSRRSH